MKSIGMPELVVIAISAFAVGVPIWIAARTKPLGPYPYRWGLYIGIKTMLMSLALAFGVITALSNGSMFGGLALATIAVCAATAAAGLIRRMRFGVVFFFIAYILMILLPLLLDALSTQRLSQRPGQVGAVVILIAVNVFYFKKRWRHMDTGAGSRIDASPADPVPSR